MHFGAILASLALSYGGIKELDLSKYEINLPVMTADKFARKVESVFPYWNCVHFDVWNSSKEMMIRDLTPKFEHQFYRSIRDNTTGIATAAFRDVTVLCEITDGDSGRLEREILFGKPLY